MVIALFGYGSDTRSRKSYEGAVRSNVRKSAAIAALAWIQEVFSASDAPTSQEPS